MVAQFEERRFVNRDSLLHQFIGMEARDEIVTYWLCPAEPERSQLANSISDLAGRFDAPVFEPHVTIHVTSVDDEKPAAVLENVLNGCPPYRLQVRGLDFSDEFTKTLFIQFAPHAGLVHLSEELERASPAVGDYELNPHLSLIYKTMDTETKRRLAATVILPFDEVIFDRVKAVLIPAEIKSREEVEAWRVIAELKLTE
jgi:hypothetical protein